MIESMFLDLTLRRLAGVRERPPRSARLAAPLLLGVGMRFREFSRNRWRESRLGTVTEQVVVVPVFCLCLARVSSSLFTARPTSRQQWLMAMGAYRR